MIVDPAYDWSGVYIGVQAGYGWGDNDYSALGSAADFDSDGFVGGLTVGANWQSGAFVYGVEADISYSNIDGSFVGDNTGFIPCADAGCTAEIDRARPTAGGPARDRGGRHGRRADRRCRA